MNAPDSRLDELFVRYWDDALTDAEADELAALLASDPEAREQFQLLCTQAVTAAELPAFTLPEVEPAPERKWSRRRALGVVGGLAAAVLVSVGSRQFWGPSRPQLRLRDSRGTVTVQDAQGRNLPADRPVPPGARVTTYGHSSSVVLSYPDGTGITLTGDSAVSVAAETDRGREVRVLQGAVTALIPRQPADSDPVTLATSLVTLTGLSGVFVTLDGSAQRTEVGVYQGAVTASRPTGEPMALVRQGESLTVWAAGGHKTQPIPPTPDLYAWDLTAPLPERWMVGRRETNEPGVPLVRAEFWSDPHVNYRVLCQVRSDNGWTRGLVRLHLDSRIRTRYRVERPGHGQFLIVVRPDPPVGPDSVVLEVPNPFRAARPGVWETIDIAAGELKVEKGHLTFGPPWTAFLVIFNTYEDDLGLCVSEFRVDPPPG